MLRQIAKRGLNLISDLHKAPGYAFYKPGQTSFSSDPRVQDPLYASGKNLRQGTQLHDFSHSNAQRGGDADRSWNDLIRRDVTEIRQIAPDIKIVVGGIRWNSASTLELLDPPYDENIIFTFHYYDPFLFTHQGAKWIKPLSDISMQYPGSINDYRRIAKKLSSYDSQFSAVRGMGRDYLVKRMEPALDIARKYDVPVYCGEYGVILTAPA